MKDVLESLKQAYTLYRPVWSEWRNQPGCSLSSSEKMLLEHYACRQFELSGTTALLRVMDKGRLLAIERKLRSDFSKFQSWAAEQFTIRVLYIGIQYDYDLFFSTPIGQLSASSTLKSAMLGFGYSTMREVVRLSQNEQLCDSKYFTHVVNALPVLAEERSLLNKGGAIL